MFDAILSGGPGGEASRESRGVWRAAGPPMVGIFTNSRVLTRGGPPCHRPEAATEEGIIISCFLFYLQRDSETVRWKASYSRLLCLSSR